MTASADSTVALWNVLDTSIYVDRFHYGKKRLKYVLSENLFRRLH